MDGNELAFPVLTLGPPHPGLTTREYFAAAALTGLCARSPDPHSTGGTGGLNYAKAAKEAVNAADALIRELSEDAPE